MITGGTSDVFSVNTPRELAEMGTSLAESSDDTTTGTTSERRPEYAVRLFKDTDFLSFGDAFPRFESLRVDLYNTSITPEALPGQEGGDTKPCRGNKCK